MSGLIKYIYGCNLRFIYFSHITAVSVATASDALVHEHRWVEISYGYLAETQSDKRQSAEGKIDDRSQHERQNGCPPPHQHPYYHFITPQWAVSPPPSLLKAPTWFPFFLVFFSFERKLFSHFTYFFHPFCLLCTSLLPDPDGPTAAYANAAPFPQHKYQLKRAGCLPYTSWNCS